MKRKGKTGKGVSKKVVLISTIALVVILAVVILLYSPEIIDNSQDSGTQKNYEQISPTELIENKEQYEGEDVELVNVLVPDPLFAYITKSDGTKERLFINPKKSEYCLYFNLKGNLQRDAQRDWIFSIDEFICVNKT